MVKIGGIPCDVPDIITELDGDMVQSDYMPANSNFLCPPKREAIRRWILSLQDLPDAGPIDAGVDAPPGTIDASLPDGPVDASPPDAPIDADIPDAMMMVVPQVPYEACGNGVRDAAEADVDCGGGAASGCAPCGAGSACSLPIDCGSLSCGGVGSCL
jgi:hypothetical protein